MYVRRYKSELKKTAKTFFDDIIRSGLFPDLKFEVKGMEMFINGKLFGFFIPLSISQSFKSIAFPNVTVICFDEFLVDKGYIKFLNNEIDGATAIKYAKKLKCEKKIRAIMEVLI